MSTVSVEAWNQAQQQIIKLEAEVAALGALIKSADPQYQETKANVLAIIAENIVLEDRLQGYKANEEAMLKLSETFPSHPFYPDGSLYDGPCNCVTCRSYG